MKLTIAIPTYNRSKRLEKALLDLCDKICSSRRKTDVSVYVCDNGSKDSTRDVIDSCKKIFSQKMIPYTSAFAKDNLGFDANVLACYSGSESDYVWFLSDDDNIYSNSIDTILDDIDAYKPSVIYYNHNQKPYDKNSPYVVRTEYFDNVYGMNLVALSKIIKWPKLTSIVVKKCPAGLRVPNLETWFAHLILSIQCGLVEGGVVHSAFFNAYPDADYMDNIDFVPHVANNIDKALRWVLAENGQMLLYDQLALPYADPLTASLNTLGAYYRGRYVLTIPLRNQLWNIVKDELKKSDRRSVFNRKLLVEVVKFSISLSYFAIYSVIRGKGPTKDRQVPLG